MKLKVADISEHNGKIDWDKVAGQIDAVIIRAGYRGYGSAGRLACDKRFFENAHGANRAKIPLGVYWLSQAISESEVAEEAAYLLNLIKPYKIDFPVYLDSEYCSPNAAGRGDGIGRERRTKYALEFLRSISEAGYTAGLYCSENWFTEEIDGSTVRGAGYTVWCARLAVKPKIGEYDAWQYTWTARLSGCARNVDMSEFYRDFAIRKNIDELAWEVIAGKWGNGTERVERLTTAGYDFAEIQKRVNEKLANKS